MNLEEIMLNETSESQKDKCLIIPHMWSTESCQKSGTENRMVVWNGVYYSF
jgi:hypothetical protein